MRGCLYSIHFKIISLEFRSPFCEWFFHRKSNLMESLFYSHPSCNQVITLKFCTWHDSCDGMTCAKFCSNMILYNGVTLNQISIKFELQLKNPLQNGPQATISLINVSGLTAKEWAGMIHCMRPANKRRRYHVTLSLIGWEHTQNHSCMDKWNTHVSQNNKACITWPPFCRWHFQMPLYLMKIFIFSFKFH